MSPTKLLDSAKKKLKYSGRCVVCVGFKIDDHTGVAIDPSMDDKAPPKNSIQSLRITLISNRAVSQCPLFKLRTVVKMSDNFNTV